MGNQLSLVHTDPDELAKHVGEAAWLPLAIEAIKTAENSWSKNTRVAYAYGIRSWHDWCRRYGEPCELPPRVEAVAAWLHQMSASGLSRSSVELRLCGLAWADQWSRRMPGKEHHSLLHHPLIRAWKRGNAIKPSRSVHFARATPPTRDELRALVHGCVVQRVRTGTARTPLFAARDRALVLLLYFGAMRKSELAALRVGDVATVSRGIEVTFVRSKTDQTGKGEVRAILPQAEAMMCAVHAWHAWLEHYRPPSPSAPAFVAFARDGTLTPKPLAYQSIDGVITCRCKDAGIRNISPHLLRAAFATHAIERNEEGQVAYHGRWKSRSTMDRYVRRGKTWIKNPTGNMGGASGT